MRKTIKIEGVNPTQNVVSVPFPFARIEVNGKLMSVEVAPKSPFESAERFEHGDVTIAELENFAEALRYLVFNVPLFELNPLSSEIRALNKLNLKLSFECQIHGTIFYCSSRSPFNRHKPSQKRGEKVIDIFSASSGFASSTSISPARALAISEQIYNMAKTLMNERIEQQIGSEGSD